MCLCKYGGFGTGWSWKASLITACGRIEDLWSNKYWNCAQLSRTGTLFRFATSSPVYTRETILLQKQLKSSAQKFHIFVPIKTKSKPDIWECMSQLASQQKSLPPCSSVSARWNTWKYADAGLSAGRVDRGQIWLLFSFFLFAASSAQGYKHWYRAGDRGEKRERNFHSLLSLPLSIHPGRKSTHLGI